MRILVQEQLCGILASVYDGVGYAVSAAQEEAETVLSDCVDAIAAIRETLGAQLSRERAAYYYERLGDVSAGLENISQKAGEVLDALSAVYTALVEEAEVKLEVAFFPYKASMWDALESIWMAARDDERCNAVVVPIRYIDRAPNGSVAAVHCERDIFPKYVPAVSVEDYDVAAHAPDIAYIHNPYDDRNYVTAVDPAYYSRELKKHVGTLVYVPYYVAGWKSGEHMVSAALSTAADVIVAHSEEEAANIKRFDPARDIPALGSPKVDRILRYEQEKPDMPSAWRDKLAGKKVFLLNTSVSSLLSHTDKFIDKLNHIFDIFQNRDDAALLWRPHPLSGATMNSMRPGLLAGYAELTRRVQEIGVFDETADVTRAIALSDAYIGEGATSLLFMYAITGKPTYILDFDIVKGLTDAERDEILRLACIPEPIAEPGGETALAVSYDTDEICRIELETGRVTPIVDIPGVTPEDMYPYQFIVDCGDKYILPPVCSDRFVELDREFKLIRSVEIPEEAKADVVFTYPVRHGDYVYFQPSWSRAFARYRVSTGEYEYFYGWYKDFAKYAEETDPGIFSGSYCVVGNKLYLPCYKDNIIAELNLDTMKIKAYRFGQSDYRYYSITHDGKAFWLTRQKPPGLSEPQWSGSIVRWDIKTGKVAEYNSFPEGFEPGAMGFRCIVCCGEYLLAFPHLANMILKIDPKTGKMSEFYAGCVKTPGNTDELLPDPKNAVFSHSGRFGADAVCGVMAQERALLSIDAKTGETKKVKLRFDKPHRAEERTASRWFMPAKYDRVNRGIFYERLLLAPDAFVDRVASGEIKDNPEQAAFYLKKVASPDGTSGEKIHEYVLGKIIEDGEE